MRKRKYSAEQKIAVCIDKEKNHLTNDELALKYSIPKTTIRDWVIEYEKSGSEAFSQPVTRKNNTYTPEFRIAVAKEKLNGNISYHELGRKYGINKCVIQSWVYKYTERGEEALKADNRNRSGRPPKSTPKTPINTNAGDLINKQLLDEVEHLRAEVAYLKKYNALVREKQKSQKKKKL